MLKLSDKQSFTFVYVWIVLFFFVVTRYQIEIKIDIGFLNDFHVISRIVIFSIVYAI